MKPVTVIDSGRLSVSELRQAVVMVCVEFGLTSRIDIGRWLVPLMDGKDDVSIIEVKASNSL